MPLSLPVTCVSKGPQASLLSISPDTSTPVTAWLVLRLYLPLMGAAAVEVNRQLPKAPLTRNDEPIVFIITLVIFGSIPVKPAYRRCQGSVANRTVASPPLQGVATLALVMKPTRSSGVFEMVAECRLPSSVTEHLTVPPSGSTNSMLVHVARAVLVLLERWLADAVLASAVSMIAALANANSVRVNFGIVIPPLE